MRGLNPPTRPKGKEDQREAILARVRDGAKEANVHAITELTVKMMQKWLES